MKSCLDRHIDGGDPVGARWVSHSFMEPHDLFNEVRV